MNIQRNILFLCVLCITCVSQVIKCHTVGSNTTSSRQLRTFFRETDDVNKMVGFSVFENGLSLENEATVCTFDAFFPMSGCINLNGGTLYLAKDAVFKYPLKFTPGTIDGCGHSLAFPSSVASVSVPSAYHNKLLHFCDMQDIGENTNDIGWSFDDKYVAVVCDSFSGYELQIYYFDTTDMKLSLTAFYNFGNDSAYSVKWNPTEYCLAVGKAGGDELYTFYFDSVTASLQVVDSADIGRVNDVDWSPDGQLLAVGRNNKDSLLVYKVTNGVLDTCYTCTLHAENVAVPKHGLAWSSSGECLAASFKVTYTYTVPTYRLKTFRFYGDYFTDGTYIETSDRMSAIAWKPDSSYIAVGFTNSNERLRVYEHDSITHALSEVLSARSGEKRSIYEVKWKGDYLAYLKDKSNITYELKVCYFDPVEKTFSIVAGANCGKDLIALAWSNSGQFVATGGKKDCLVVFDFRLASLVFKDIKLFFDSDVIIGGDVVFEGSCIVDCGRNNLEFLDEGSITVASGSSLLLSDAIIRGVSGNKISCADDDCVLQLKDVTWFQDGNYTFSTGAMIFENDVAMSGDYTFAYQTMKTSTILSKSTLALDAGFVFSYEPANSLLLTFSYNPENIVSKDLIALEDSSSTILLNGATLHATCEGMELKKGRLRVSRDSFLSSEKLLFEGIYFDGGITFGDGTVENDLLCYIYAGNGLNAIQGTLKYKNVLPSSFAMGSDRSFLRIYENAQLNVYQNLDMGDSIIYFDDNVTLGISLGKKIIGSVCPYGILNRFLIDSE